MTTEKTGRDLGRELAELVGMTAILMALGPITMTSAFRGRYAPFDWRTFAVGLAGTWIWFITAHQFLTWVGLL